MSYRTCLSTVINLYDSCVSALPWDAILSDRELEWDFVFSPPEPAPESVRAFAVSLKANFCVWI